MTSENSSNNMVMPVAPMYGGGYNANGGFGFGGDWAWILLLLVLGGGWGGFGGFGMGGAMMGAGMWGMDMLYPWLDNSQHISDGFRDQQLATQISGVRDAVTTGFGNTQLGIAGVNQNICQTGNTVVSAINAAQNATAQQLYSNEIANLNRSFAEQSANQQGFNGVQAGLADVRYTEATENCATRTAAYQNTRDIIDAVGRGNQTIIDKLCALELDGVKSQLAQAQRDNIALQNAVNLATEQASRVAQSDDIVDRIYSRLSSCPVGTTPVYGNTPIFTCPVNVANGSNCGCNGFN